MHSFLERKTACRKLWNSSNFIHYCSAANNNRNKIFHLDNNVGNLNFILQIYCKPDIFLITRVTLSEWKASFFSFYREKFDHVSHDADDNGGGNNERIWFTQYILQFLNVEKLNGKIVMNLNYIKLKSRYIKLTFESTSKFIDMITIFILI